MLDSASLLFRIKKKFSFWVWGYLWVTLQAGVFSNFWPNLPGPGRQPNGPFFGSLGCFFGNLAKIRLFRALDWLSSIIGTKITAQKPNFRQKKVTQKVRLALSGQIWPAITRQQIELESCSNLLKMGKVLQLAIKKIVSVLNVGFFDYVYMMEVCLCISVLLPMTSSSSESRPNEPILWCKILLDSRL